MLLVFQNKTNIEIIQLMHFRFALDSSDIDLLNIDLLDTHLDMLDTNIPSKHLFLSKTSWRRRQDMSSRHPEGTFKTSWKTKNCYAEDVLKTSSRHVFKTSLRRLEDQQMFAGLNQQEQVLICQYLIYQLQFLN